MIPNQNTTELDGGIAQMNNRRFLREDYEVVRYMLGNAEKLEGIEWLTNDRTGKIHQDEFRMWLDGAPYKKIAEVSCISPGMARNNVIKTGHMLMRRHLEKPVVTNIGKFFDFIKKVAKDIGFENAAVRAANSFVRAQDSPKDWEDIDFLGLLKEIELDDLIKINGIGGVSIRILLEARTRLRHVCDRCGEVLPDDFVMVRLMTSRFDVADLRLCNECRHKLALWLKNQ